MMMLAAVPVFRQGMLREMGARAAETIRRGVGQAQQVFAGAEAAQAELSLPERTLFALQLGVFDSPERAAEQAKRLQAGGAACIIWQGEKLRVVSDASFIRENLDAGAAKGYDIYVYQETIPPVTLRLSADVKALEGVKNLLTLPDSILIRLTQERQEPLDALVAQVRREAENAISAHPENTLYTQLAQSLINWCDLMEESMQEGGAYSYARATMGALCRELRRALSA